MGQVSDNYSLEGMNPLDSKLVYPSKSIFLAAITFDPMIYFRFYYGMIIFLQENKEEWIWVEMSDERFAETPTLLDDTFVYPPDTVAYGFTYSGKSFNFIKYSDYLSITELNETYVRDLQNEGVGVDYYNGIDETTKRPKIARGNSSSLKLTKQEDGSVSTEMDMVNIGSPEGISIYEFITASKLHTISKLLGENLIIQKKPNGDILIKALTSGTSSSDWNLDANFQRPENWGQATNPKQSIEYSTAIDNIYGEIRPGEALTVGESYLIPTGSLNDPFITYEEFLLAYIYKSGVGAINRAKPTGVVLNVRSNVSTYSTVEVANCKYVFFATAIYYKGVREYALDTGTILDNLPKDGSGKLTRDSNITLAGEGAGIINENGFGIIRHETDIYMTSNGYMNYLSFNPTALGLEIQESIAGLTYVRLTNAFGAPLSNGNSPVFGVNQAPVTPLIKIIGCNSGYWSGGFIGTRFSVTTNTQKGIKFENGAKLTSSLQEFAYQISNRNVGYSKKLSKTETAPGSGIYNYDPPTMSAAEKEMVDENYISSDGQGYVFYKPHDEYSMFDIGNKCSFRVENFGTVPNGFIHFAANSIFLMRGNNTDMSEDPDLLEREAAVINNLISYKDTGGGPSLFFIRSQGYNNSIVLTGGSMMSETRTLVESEVGKSFVMTIINMTISNLKQITRSVFPLKIYTSGTLSSIKGIPILTTNNIAEDNDAAILQGLRPGMLYHNSTTDDLGHVK